MKTEMFAIHIDSLADLSNPLGCQEGRRYSFLRDYCGDVQKKMAKDLGEKFPTVEIQHMGFKNTFLLKMEDELFDEVVSYVTTNWKCSVISDDELFG